MSVLRVLGHALRVALVRVLWYPIREGRPRAGDWPGWLLPVVLVAGAGYLVAGGLTLGSGWIRQHDRLVTDGSLVIGAWTVTVLFWLVVLTLALLATAALHVHPLVRVIALGLVGTGMIITTLGITALPILVAVACFLGLVLLAVLRAPRRAAWFEFPIVLGLVVVGVFGARALGQSQLLGVDTRMTALLLLLSVTTQLALPTLVMAGYALAEIPVTVGEAIGRGVHRRFGPIPVAGVWVLLALTTVVAGWDIASGVWNRDWNWRLEAWGASLMAVLLTAGLARLLLRGRRLPARPRVSDAFGSLGYPIAVALVGFVVAATAVLMLTAMAGALGVPGGTALSQALGELMTSDRLVALTRCLVAVAVLLVALRRARDGEPVTVVPAAAFVVLVAGGSLALWSGGRLALSWSIETLLAWCVLAALLRLAVAAARGRAGEASWPTLGVLLIAALAGRRDLLAEPASLAAGVSGMAVLLLGLIWRLLTDAQITRGDSRGFPRVTRVLLYAANSLIAVLALAVVALSRTDQPQFDLDNFAEMGLTLIGAPMLLGSLLVALFRATASGATVAEDPAVVHGDAAFAAPRAEPGRVHTPQPSPPGT